MYMYVYVYSRVTPLGLCKEVVNNCVGSAMQPYVQCGKVSGVMEEARIRIRTT
jgi:hypothetical protein